jgi:hypothetical protein
MYLYITIKNGGFMPTRKEGYRYSEGKEEPALIVAENFIKETLDYTTSRITDGVQNYQLGDLLINNGVTIEVKGQLILFKFFKKQKILNIVMGLIG